MHVPPQTPADIAVYLENGNYVFRSLERAIYYSDRDFPDQSNCVASCSLAWPPVVVQETSDLVGAWSIVVRPDRIRQWAYKRRPVYTYAADEPGKALGDGREGAWHIVVP